MRLVVGTVVGPHGIRGEVSVDARTDEPSVRFAYGGLLDTDPVDRGPLRVVGARPHGERLLVRFAGVRDRAGAERLRGARLTIDSQRLTPSEASDEWGDHELVGLDAVTSTGTEIGTVTDVAHVPGQDLLVVDLRDGGEALVPFVSAIVTAVECQTGRLVLEPPPGLLEGGSTASGEEAESND